MALNFPNSPTVGLRTSTDNRTWEWTGTSWKILTTYSTIQGIQGVQGTSRQGSQGTQGVGVQGPLGRQGAQGTQGRQGSQGLQGLQGVQGLSGPSNTILATDDTSTATLYPVMVGATGSNQTAKARSTSQAFSFNASSNILSVANIALPQNPNGVGYGTTTAKPTYSITQTMGDNDGWRIYGESPSGTNTGSMIIEVTDDVNSTEKIVFRNRRDYTNAVLGVSTFMEMTNTGNIIQNVPLLIGSASSTGTASQRLQVTGDSYVSGNLGVGITNAIFPLDVSVVSGSAARFRHPSFNDQINIDFTTNNYPSIYSINNDALEIASFLNVDIVLDYTNISSDTYFRVLRGARAGLGTEIFRIQENGNVGIGTSVPTSELHVVGGDARFSGVTETVAAATTYNSGSVMVLEMDAQRATTYTYTMPTGANIGIVSFKNIPAQTGNASGSTMTLIVTQNAAGTGNTTGTTGIGTNCTVVGFENGAAVAGISTRALVSFASTTTLSTTGNDTDFVSFFVNYTGGTNTVSSSYKIYTTKNGGFRRGVVGV